MGHAVFKAAAAKCHIRLNLQSFLPGCVIVGSAAEHDSRRTRELYTNIHAGEIVICARLTWILRIWPT
jgi:hypothetical protein